MAVVNQPVAAPGIDDPDAHPSREKTYIVVAIVLFVFTVIEVATYYVPDFFGGQASTALIAALLVLMVLKFVTVVSYFMHLKWDSKLLTAIFYSGLALALLVFIAVLLAFRFFAPGPEHMVPLQNA